MTQSDIENAAQPAPEAAGGAEHAYNISRQGRRQAVILLLGVVSIWIFALWTLITILLGDVSWAGWVSLLLMLAILVVAPVVVWTLLEEAYSGIVTRGTGIEYRSLAGIALAYDWHEITGFKPETGKGRIAKFFLGKDSDEVDINDKKVSNAGAAELRPGDNNAGETVANEGAAGSSDGDDAEVADTDEDEQGTLLLAVRDDHASRIANPVVRFLHRQAHGRAVPIYGGLEGRRELLDEIAQHSVKRET